MCQGGFMVRRQVWKIIPVVLALAAGVALFGIPYEPVPDSGHYIHMAGGQMQLAPKPFANRILHPFVAQGLVQTTGCGVDLAFAMLAIAAFCLLVTAISCLTPESLSGVEMAALLASPLLFNLFRNWYLPDLWHAAWLAFFLLALHRRWFVSSLAILFILQISRESTVLLALVVVLLAVVQRRWKYAIGAGIAVALGILVVRHFTKSAQPNIHHMNDLAYLVAKVPANTLANLLGVIPWTDSYQQQMPEFYPGAPLWKMAVPHGLPSGGIHEIGIYRIDPQQPLRTALLWLTLPVKLFMEWAVWQAELKYHFLEVVIMH